MAVSRAMTASGQSVLAMLTAVGASDNPMMTITGPTTTDGKSRSMNLIPRTFTKAETIP